MGLRPEPIGEIPAETVRVARAALPKGTVITRLRDEFSALYQDDDFRNLYPTRGQPGLAPWRLALVTVFQFLEHLSDHQAAAAVHDLHLLELVAETLRAALDDLAAVVPDWLRGVAQPVWFERYGRRVEDYRLPKRREEREALALAVGADGFLLLDALDAPGAPAAAREVPMVQTLRDVWRVHYAREGDGPPRWRAGAELPPVGERLQSPYDPEAHYSTKRQIEWSGYKVHVTETCDEDAAHLITHVMTCPAMQQDMTSTAEIHERLADKDLLPAEHFVDSAYVDAALLVGSRRDHGVSLEGPVRGVANRHTGAAQGFAQRDFTIDWERERVTCPRGKASVTWRAGLDEVGAPRIQAVFSRTDCGACTARELCTPAKAARRSVYFHPREEYEALNAARARMHDPAWKQRYRVRAGIEGTLSQAVRAFGMRRSRYVGLAKTGLQQVCTAAAMNASRVVRWLGGVPRARTRVTRFAALAQPA